MFTTGYRRAIAKEQILTDSYRIQWRDRPKGARSRRLWTVLLSLIPRHDCNLHDRRLVSLCLPAEVAVAWISPGIDAVWSMFHTVPAPPTSYFPFGISVWLPLHFSSSVSLLFLLFLHSLSHRLGFVKILPLRPFIPFLSLHTHPSEWFNHLFWVSPAWVSFVT